MNHRRTHTTALLLSAMLGVSLATLGSIPGAQAAAPLPGSATEGVLFDLERIVILREQRGWAIDRFVYESLLPDALLSVCAAPGGARRDAAQALSARVKGLGGPVEAVWRARGRDLGEVSKLLRATRVRRLLLMAMKAAKRDCPFWLTPKAAFSGRHRDVNRLALGAEGGGLLTFRTANGRAVGGGGGAGRIVVSQGFAQRWSLRGGVEVGGGALADKELKVQSIGTEFFATVPVTLRRVGVSWLFDFEAAAVALGVPWREAEVMRYGVRAGVLGGFSYLRLLDVLPWAGYAVNFEYVFGRKGLPDQWSIRAGFRLGFSWRGSD